ncbi:serine/threonine-protein phosphatase 6 regulatory ankyrin repeat subunit B isoform X1 [Histomonas meleagridis]|uniref:serine/threonine-protein phosphatase 6 regulatory ankyrin repeat subunit B isoform X1 n=1 Tax=Histomonas meleagridis TaxID=135588 RepID=UPI0035596C56|nr:serine/threonine-protein phosphatase 6 regulatory ankyrin repeat subunit B isoform X1 [Histomonas meleagridis]KAH0797553.1 serine/threonine-protein phosphatase 6 regulatory ankyrin repeat subunit B isoform X1 [Histomonas meleagridis]
MKKFVIITVDDNNGNSTSRTMNSVILEGKNGKVLLEKLSKQSSFPFEAGALLYCDPTFSIPISPQMKPLESFPQLVQEKLNIDLTDSASIVTYPRLVLVLKKSPRIGKFIITFRDAITKRVVDIPFPIKVKKQSTLLTYIQSFSKEFTPENITQIISRKISSPPKRIKLNTQINEEKLPLDYDIQHSFINQNGTFIFSGNYIFEVEPSLAEQERVTIINQLTENNNQQPFAHRLTKLKSDIKGFFETEQSFSNTFSLLIPLISQEFDYESKDPNVLLVLKTILNEVLTPILANNISKMDKRSDYKKCKNWNELSHLFLTSKTDFKVRKQLTLEEIIPRIIETTLLSSPMFIEQFVDISFNCLSYFNGKSDVVTENNQFYGPIIFYSMVVIETIQMTLVVTRGFIYLLSGKPKNIKNFCVFPEKFEIDQSQSIFTLPIQMWSVIPTPSSAHTGILMISQTQQFLMTFGSPEQLVMFMICFQLCSDEIEKTKILPKFPIDCIIEFNNNANNNFAVNIKFYDFDWNLEIPISQMKNEIHLMQNYINPGIDNTSQIPFNYNQDLVCFGTHLSSENYLQYIKQTSNKFNKNFELTFYKALLIDMIFSHEGKAVFYGFLPFKISDFLYGADKDEILFLLQIGCFNNYLQDYLVNGIPFVHYLCQTTNKIELLKYLENKLELEDINNKKRTPIFYSLQNPNISIFKTLIEMKANVDYCDSTGISPLVECYEQKDTEKLMILLENGALVHDTLENDYKSLIEYVLIKHDLETLEILLPFLGNKVNFPNAQGQFLIHLCLSNNFPDAIYLMQQKCQQMNPNMYSKTVEHPLHYIFTSHLTEVMLKALLSLPNLNLNVFDDNGDTPLTKSVKSEVVFFVQMLAKDNRCDIDMYNKEGLSPLYLAVKANSLEITKILIDAGALVNQPIATGETAIFEAVREGKAEMVEFLLKSGANVNQWYYKGKLASQIAPENIAKIIHQYTTETISLSFDS